jgi:hypothetical protein
MLLSDKIEMTNKTAHIKRWVWWCKPETLALGRLRQEDHKGYEEKPCLTLKKIIHIVKKKPTSNFCILPIYLKCALQM